MTMALHSLISGRFPSDYLGIVGFSRSAREINFRDLPEVSWDYDWGTNIQHGLAVARQLLSHQRGTKQVIMVTDGEPTAHWPAGATEPVFAYPATQETVDATLVEVARCTRDHIRINTFALDATGHLRHFVEQMTRLNRGKAFFTTPEASATTCWSTSSSRVPPPAGGAGGPPDAAGATRLARRLWAVGVRPRPARAPRSPLNWYAGPDHRRSSSCGNSADEGR